MKTKAKGKPTPVKAKPVAKKAPSNAAEGYGARQGTSRATVIDVICAAAGLKIQCGTTIKGRVPALTREAVCASCLAQPAFEGKASKPEWYLGNALKFIKAKTGKTLELAKPERAAPAPKAKAKPAAKGKATVKAKPVAKGKPKVKSSLLD